MTGKAGAVLLHERERQTKLLERFAQCFEDHRQAGKVEHSVAELIAQRVYSLLLGEEDLNDHDELSRDAFLAFLVGKSDLMGQSRRQMRLLRRRRWTFLVLTAETLVGWGIAILGTCQAALHSSASGQTSNPESTGR